MKIEFHKVFFGDELDEAVRIFIDGVGTDIVLYKKDISEESWNGLIQLVNQ